MKKRELYHKGIGLLVIVAFIIIALLVLDFGINKHVVTDSTPPKSSSIHKTELFSCYEKNSLFFRCMTLLYCDSLQINGMVLIHLRWFASPQMISGVRTTGTIIKFNRKWQLRYIKAAVLIYLY